MVIIATASGAHMEPCLAAAKAGKHIICEKPLEITSARIEQMTQVCAEAGVTLAGIYNRRYNPAFRALQEAVRQGRFGRIALASAYLKWYRDNAYYASAPWRGTWALDGGGALMNQGIHTIDQLLTLAGPVKQLSGSVTTRIHPDIEVEDTAVAALEFTSGARGVIEGSTSCWAENGLPAEVHICGEYGSVVMVDERFRHWEFAHPVDSDEEIHKSLMLDSAIAGAGAKDPMAIKSESHRLAFEAVVEAIKTGQPPEVTGKVATMAVRVIEGIYASARDGGQPVVLA